MYSSCINIVQVVSVLRGGMLVQHTNQWEERSLSDRDEEARATLSHRDGAEVVIRNLCGEMANARSSSSIVFDERASATSNRGWVTWSHWSDSTRNSAFVAGHGLRHCHCRCRYHYRCMTATCGASTTETMPATGSQSPQPCTLSSVTHLRLRSLSFASLARSSSFAFRIRSASPSRDLNSSGTSTEGLSRFPSPPERNSFVRDSRGLYALGFLHSYVKWPSFRHF